MYTNKLIRILPSTICVILTWASYSEGEVEDVLITNIIKQIMLKKE